MHYNRPPIQSVRREARGWSGRIFELVSLRRIGADPAPTPRREAGHALALVPQDGPEPGGAGADPVGLAGLVLAGRAGGSELHALSNEFGRQREAGLSGARGAL